MEAGEAAAASPNGSPPPGLAAAHPAGAGVLSPDDADTSGAAGTTDAAGTSGAINADATATEPGAPAPGLVAAIVAGISALLRGFVAPLTSSLASLPRAVASAVVAALNERDNKAREAAGLARIKGDSWGELAEKNNLAIRRGATDADTRLVCLACEAHCPSLQTDPGVFGVSQRLCDLRKAVHRHFACPTHAKSTNIAAQLKAAEKQQHASGMAVGRAIFFELKEANSYYSFERLLMLLSQCGVYVGTLNHSRKFAADFVVALYSAMVKRVRCWLNEPDPALGGRLRVVAFNADKSTELRQTGQILALIVMVEGEMRSVMLADSIVLSGGGTAAGLAKTIVDGIAKFIPPEELPQRCAGFCFDGQYLCEDVPGALCSLLGLKFIFHTFFWDKAHLLELVINDVRLDKTGLVTLQSVDWYAPLSETVALLLNSFQYGKGYEEIRAIASELDLDLRDPAKFCETRFAASEKKVIDGLLVNFLVYVQAYRAASTIPEGATKGRSKVPRTERNVEERAKLSLLNKLTDMMFVGRLLILRDLFQHISKFSLFAQTVNVLPWELRDAEDELLAMLKEIYMAADASKEEEGHPPATLLPQYFPLLYAGGVWDELKRGCFKGVPLNLPWVGDDEGSPQEPGKQYTLEQFPTLLIDEAHDFVKALCHFFVIRFVDCKGAPRQSQGERRGGHQFEVPGAKEARRLVEAMRDCFDLRKLCLEPCPLIRREEALGDIYSAAIESGVKLSPLPDLVSQLEVGPAVASNSRAFFNP